MKKILTYSILFLGLVLCSFSQNDQLRKLNFNIDKQGIAIKGYDPVSYIDKGEAMEGNSKWSFNYKGIVYYFSSERNRDLFKSNPEKYEPEYGGWCAYAMGNTGEKVEIDPKTFKIINGKTYLFYNFYFTNTLKSWNKDEAGLKTKADANWKKIKL